MTTIEKAIKVIIANEGNYASVNANDNGALSIGICQWHGSRAKTLAKKIYSSDPTIAKKILNSILEGEILDNAEKWNKRILDDLEKNIMKVFISTPTGTACQTAQARKDVQAYINHIMSFDITDEDSIIFLADIENQGGAGASKRIINNTFTLHGKNATLTNFMSVTLIDKVFKNYTARRNTVYKYLTGTSYKALETTQMEGITYIVKAGDSLYNIAKMYGTTIYELVRLNNISDPSLILIGDKLIITEKHIQIKGIIHIVQKNETLYAIAYRYGTSIKKIVDDNNVKNPALIFVGQELKIIK